MSALATIDHGQLFAQEGLDSLQVLRGLRTQRAVNYQRLFTGTKARYVRDKSFRADMDEMIDMVRRGVAPNVVHQNAFMDNFSVQYANDDYVADRLMPAVPVTKRSNSYVTYSKRDRFGFPNDEMGPDGRASEISENRGSANYSVKDYGLMNSVTQETLDNQDAVFDEMLDVIDSINEGIAWNREKRVAVLARDPANYGGNVQTLSGTSQWGGTTADPIKNIQDGLASQWRGPGAVRKVFSSGIEVYNQLARDPAIRDLYKYTGTGLALPQAIANFFGVDEYLVAMAREDTANSGQTPVYGRIWGKDFICLNVQRRPSKRTATWGVTFRMNGDPTVLQWFDPSRGRGAYFAKVVCSEDCKIVAGDTGFIIQNAVA